MIEIDILFQTQNGQKITFWRGTYLYSLYKELPPGAKNAVQIMSLAAYASETKKAIKVTLKINQKYKGVNKL